MKGKLIISAKHVEKEETKRLGQAQTHEQLFMYPKAVKNSRALGSYLRPPPFLDDESWHYFLYSKMVSS